jgi:hypothetical protein
MVQLLGRPTETRYRPQYRHTASERFVLQTNRVPLEGSQVVTVPQNQLADLTGDITANVTWPDSEDVRAVVEKLRPSELRWLAGDLIGAAIRACATGETSDLRGLLMSWLETADVMISTRRQLRHILRAEQEMRARLG